MKPKKKTDLIHDPFELEKKMQVGEQLVAKYYLSSDCEIVKTVPVYSHPDLPGENFTDEESLFRALCIRVLSVPNPHLRLFDGEERQLFYDPNEWDDVDDFMWDVGCFKATTTGISLLSEIADFFGIVELEYYLQYNAVSSGEHFYNPNTEEWEPLLDAMEKLQKMHELMAKD